jgi:hypothetical protein
MKTRYQWMDTHLKRMLGAQFRKSLGREIFVFHYPQAAPRLFHTMWCPPLRIVVLNIDNGNHNVLFDQVIQPWRFVYLPAGKLVLEMDPGDDYKDILPEILSTVGAMQQIDSHLLVGGTDSNVSVGQLLFALFAESLRDLRSVKMTCLNERGLLDPAKLVKRYSPWERGRILASAGFVLDFSGETSWLIPQGAIPLSADVLKYENQYADELLAAAHAAVPDWKAQLQPICLGCGDGGSWRSVLPGDASLPVEKSWRLLRPENNIPLCSCCAKRFKLTKKPYIRDELARSFWGARFEAMDRWFLAEIQGGRGLPSDWNKADYPLWPRSFGGNTWETGSGAVKHVAPRWPQHVERTTEHIAYLKDAGMYDFVLQYQYQSF